MNRLYYGDCLTVIREMNLSSVDLIYLDPPFNSKKDYHNLYKDETGRPLPDQVEAFSDMWVLDEERERAIQYMPILVREAGIDDKVAEFWRIWMNALRATQPGLLAYLSYMVERMIWMKGILRPNGALYLHCDPTASHYIKIMLDGIFGHKNFRNEIVWHYRRWTTKARKFQSLHDVIFFYSKSDKYTFNQLYTPYTEGSKARKKQGVLHRFKKGEEPFLVSNKEMDERGVPENDVWQIPFIAPSSKERVGYKTQKPLKLLEHIIQASSNEGDMVLDPFCGCATTLEAAHRLNRKWVGIDIAIHAVKRVARVRLTERLGLKQGEDFIIEGVPRNMEGAKDLWGRDKYQFQKWAVEQVDGFVTNKKTADGGIDGRLYFGAPGEPLESMVLEVKGGKNVNIGDLRALHSVLERDTAKMAGLIIMEPLGERQDRNFHKEMAQAGDYEANGIPYSRIQMLTVPEILKGERFKTPFARGHTEKIQPELDV